MCERFYPLALVKVSVVRTDLESEKIFMEVYPECWAMYRASKIANASTEKMDKNFGALNSFCVLLSLEVTARPV